NKGTTPLERTFRLDELEFGSPPDATYRRAQLARGTRALSRAGFTLLIQENSKPAVPFQPPGGAAELVYCSTMLADDPAVVGTAFGLYLVDLKTNRVLRSYRGHSGQIQALASAPDDRFFLSGATDQTLRVWAVQQDEPLLSLFVAEEDWIAWTPE